MEYKCPHEIRDYEVDSHWNETSFFRNIGCVISFKKIYSYYHQIIGQITLAQCNCSYFIVWMKKGKLLNEKIQIDCKCWENIWNRQIIFFKNCLELEKFTVAQSVRSNL